MTEKLNIALCQYNPLLGDLKGNVTRMRALYREMVKEGADLVVFPELSISGYPPEDLVLGPTFVAACRKAVEELAAITVDGPGLICGSVWLEGGRRYNALLLLEQGKVAAIRPKHNLPNYLVFDEKRLFDAGPLPEAVVYRGVRLGLLNCEDMWYPEVTAHLKAQDAAFLLVANASPFSTNKQKRRFAAAQARVRESGLPLLYLNQIGGQDTLVFDGGSFALQADGTLASRWPRFEECSDIITCAPSGNGWQLSGPAPVSQPEGDSEIYAALVLGLRDYVQKNYFSGVVLGLSGGIDSALTAAVAVDALGAEQVHCLMMPSQFTSTASLEDAAACAESLGVKLDTLPITSMVGAFEQVWEQSFGHLPVGLTHENVQARLRGLLLMAVSNETGAMLLTTGNKSEMAVGYTTLYGDMNGGYSVLKDVYKTTVFRLARWRNAHLPLNGRGPGGQVIPERILSKPPSAELRPDQTDQDSLPPYDVLDKVLYALVEEQRSVAEVAAQGFERPMVEKVQKMLYAAEYKRRQSPPGVRVSTRAFDRDRRYPITNRFFPS